MKKQPVMMMNNTGIVSSRRRAMNLNMAQVRSRSPVFPHRGVAAASGPFLNSTDASSSR